MLRMPRGAHWDCPRAGDAVAPASAPPRAQRFFAHRFAMARWPFETIRISWCRISKCRHERGDASYSATTLDRLAAQGVNTPSRVHHGADAFRDIATWMDSRRFWTAATSRPSPARQPVIGLRALLPHWRAG